MAGLSLFGFNNYDKSEQTSGVGARGRALSSQQRYDQDDADTAAISRRVTTGNFSVDRRQEEADNEAAVTELARRLSRAPTSYGAGKRPSPFNQPEDSPLNPNSSNFNAKQWVKSLIANESQETLRTSGVAFRDLSAHGINSGSEYQVHSFRSMSRSKLTVSLQKTFGNGFLSLFGKAKALLTGNKGRKIDILQNFAGVLKSGEMLVVLGPPGRCVATILLHTRTAPNESAVAALRF